jgi:hypothetical protein
MFVIGSNCAQAYLVISRFDDLVRIEVGTGDELRSFTVHGAFLTPRSLFFKKALSGAWKEAEERVIKLPEDSNDTFELYLQVIYGQPISVEPDPVPENYKGSSERLELAKLYVFAEKVQDARTKNVVTKAFLNSVWKLHKCGKWSSPHHDCVNVVYRGTAPGSPMRRLIVDIFAYTITNPVTFEPKDWPKEFFAELGIGLLTTRLTDSFKKRHLKRGDSADGYLEAEGEEANNK